MDTGCKRASWHDGMGNPFYFGSNFKMHQTAAESAAFLRAIAHAAAANYQLFLIPPFTSLAAVTPIKGDIWIGAQTMHEAEEGAYTGEISARMLSALGVDLVMLGHAERRQHFGETDAALRRKVRQALDHGLRVLLCVGETALEHECSASAETVTRQLKIALRDCTTADLPRLMIAYEPVWSIGVGGTPAPIPDVISAVNAIRGTLRALFDTSGDLIPVLYGGSVDADNVGSYVQIDGIDGAFVGRAAWTPDGFLNVFNRASTAKGW
jgi:triosephosphate isomerase